MKKVLTLAVLATLLMTGSVFAQFGRHVVAEPNATFAFGVGGAAAGPSTTNNDDTCDIGHAPAATLLLPYFEVETSARNVDTFFTIVNTSYLPQIAHVTVWTDWSMPILDFNVFLTGYDVQSLSLYDIIVNGIIAPTNPNLTAGGTSSTTTPGSASALNNANPNISLVGCANLPGFIPANLRAAIQAALTDGTPSAVLGCTGTARIGSAAGTHPSATTAVGYVTIDVTSVCSTTLPNSLTYFTTEILFDNVFTGDYQVINKATGNNFTGANPLVHIRAVPEGGRAGFPLTGAQTNFPRTFYARYTNTAVAANNTDRRQPLPSVWAARWIQGGAAAQNTNVKMWREGVTGLTTCATASSNASLSIAEVVRFDARENPTTYAAGIIISPSVPVTVVTDEADKFATSSTSFPPLSTSGDDNGWMYMNLDLVAPQEPFGASDTTLHPAFVAASQSWVTVEMTGSGSTAGLFAGEFDATWLGNGCSGAVGTSTINGGTVRVGPVGGVLVCPPGATAANCVAGTAPYVGTNTTP